MPAGSEGEGHGPCIWSRSPPPLMFLRHTSEGARPRQIRVSPRAAEQVVSTRGSSTNIGRDGSSPRTSSSQLPFTPDPEARWPTPIA